MSKVVKFVVGLALLLALNILALTQQKEPLAAEVAKTKRVCSSSPTHWTCGDDLYVLSEAIYFESRSEYWTGQEAVGFVIMNRVRSSDYPKTVREVVYQDSEKKGRCQFSYVCDGKSEKIRDLKAWNECVLSAYRVYYGIAQDNTHGAMFYINKEVSTNQAFFQQLYYTKKIGNHTFYRSTPITRV